MLAPELALFLAIDFDCFLQNMASATGAREDQVVTYYVNRDSAGWVEQCVRRRVYIELKLECTRNRCMDNQKARDDWLCLYCRASFPSKLRLTDHRVVGCPCGPVDSKGVKWELPVYPNLKTAKQGKDLKLALQRGEGSIWRNLHDDAVWLDLNPELRDLIYPPLGARVQLRKFLEPTIASLTPTPAHAHQDVRPQMKTKVVRPPKPQPASGEGDCVVIEDEDTEDEPKTPPSRPKKRPHAEMEEGQRPYFSSRAYKASPRKATPTPHPERHSQHLPRSTRPQSSDGSQRRPPPHPVRVAPIQSRSPSPERAIILPPPPPPSPPPMPEVIPTPSPVPHVTRSPPPMNRSACTQDLATGLRKDRQAFYVKVASDARASVKMDTTKPALRPPIQPPGLFFLIACGLLKLDLEFGDFQGFQGEVDKWVNDPHFLDRLYAAYGRYCHPLHQVLPAPLHGHFVLELAHMQICIQPSASRYNV